MKNLIEQFPDNLIQAVNVLIDNHVLLTINSGEIHLQNIKRFAFLNKVFEDKTKHIFIS